MAADQAALRDWQSEHEHKIQIAQTVATLCGAESETDKLPASVRDNTLRTHQYLSELEAYFEQCILEEAQISSSNVPGDFLLLPDMFKSLDMRKSIQTRSGSALPVRQHTSLR
ncbi:Membrane protein [Pseudomonas tremae]|uniref:Membrane protein n=1 Tax=Pseudomonas tremae TaxID=200454 RepID=A0AA40P427_9PSED|nr:Membrane protein [Pseudomonas tremae]